MRTIRSMAITGYHTWRVFGFKFFAREAYGMMRAVLGAVINPEKRTDKYEKQARRVICRVHCHVYDPKTDSCGTPGQTMIEGNEQIKIGCWCPVAIASFVKKKSCWLDRYGQSKW